MPAGRETTYDVRVWKVQKITGAKTTTYRLRWQVNRQTKSIYFPTLALADSRRSELVSATRRGEPFDLQTGLPLSLIPDERTVTWWDWVLTYVDLKWLHLAPTSRRSLAEALVTATFAMLADTCTHPPRAQLRTLMFGWAFNAPRRKAGPPTEELQDAARWLESNTLPLRALEKPAIARRLLDAVAKKLDGTPAAPTTIARKRAVVYNVCELAVERELFPANPLARIRWKAPKVADEFDPRAVINPDQARALLAVVGNLAKPGESDRKIIGQAQRGRRLVAFFGLLYYSALRPSEALALTEADLELPESDGWGQLLLARSNAEISGPWTDEGRRTGRQLKHRARGAVRVVPCPPPLVDLLRTHIAELGTARDGRLFCGPYGGQISANGYAEIWQLARKAVFTEAEQGSPLGARPYDLRHAAVSTWLAAGVDSVQVAAWAGHSVAVLHRVYAHVLNGQTDAMLSRIASLLQPSSRLDRPTTTLPPLGEGLVGRRR